MYEILVTGPLCTSECAGECRLSANLRNRTLDVTAVVIVEATRNADILTINASEDFQKNSQSNTNDYKTHSEEKVTTCHTCTFYNISAERHINDTCKVHKSTNIVANVLPRVTK